MLTSGERKRTALHERRELLRGVSGGSPCRLPPNYTMAGTAMPGDDAPRLSRR